MIATKPSGIAWIGNIPPDWEMKKVKYISTLKGRIGWQGLTSDEYTDEGAYLITGTDFDNGRINWETCVHVPMKRWEEAKDIQIENGDLLITKDGTVGKVAIVDGLESPCSLNSGVLRISTKNGYDRRFLFWVLQSEVFWTWFSIKNAGNSTILHLYQGDFAEFNYAIPTLTEQCAIAAFLFDRCGYIDGIIADLERQLEILRQYKKALITETVTKGLDKSAPMKDSGIDIVGNMDATWGIKRLKYLSDIQTGNQDTQDAIEDGEYPFYVRSPIVERINKYDFDGEAILLAGDGVGAGKVFHFANGKFGCHQRVYIIHNFKHVNAKFLFYFLSNFFSIEIEKGSAKSTVDSIRLPMLQNFFVCIPSLAEQTAIVTYLDNKCAETDALIAEKLRSVEIMRQYKRSLIYEYVTGKKRVAG